ncbi:MAG: BatD family protein [Bacteroidota bacterium]|nr:BatD family protein [Bacteroidota bacterium]
MRRMHSHIIGSAFLFLLLMGKDLCAQSTRIPKSQAQAPQVHATVDKSRILIGEPIQLMLEATVAGNAPLTWPALDSLPHFEFVGKGTVDSTVRPDGRYYRQYLTVTSFDSGTHAIPRLSFTVGSKRVFTDSVRVEVDFSKFDPKQDYHDIRDIIDVPNPYVKWIAWIVGAVTLLCLALAIWLVGRRRLLPGADGASRRGQPLLSPYDQAMRQLDELALQKAWENGPVKTYYTQLNDVLRLFVLRRLGIASLAETNEELIRGLRGVGLSEQAYASLAETLRMSDFVKFAKYVPAAIDNEHHFGVIRSSVGHMEQIARDVDAAQEQAMLAAAAAGGSGATVGNGRGDGTMTEKNRRQ